MLKSDNRAVNNAIFYVSLRSKMDNNTNKHKTQASRWTGILLKFVVPVVISAGLCWLLFRDFDFSEMWRVITEGCDFRWIALGLAISVMSHVFRALRWRIQLRAIDVNPPLFSLVLSIFGTYAVNLVLPRLGEVWRTGYIARRQDASFAAVFGSMVADRLADTVTVGLLTLFTLVVASGQIMSYLADSGATLEHLRSIALSPWLWGAVVAAAAALWWLMAGKTESRAILKLREALRQLWDGFAAIARMPGKGRWLAYTVCIWGCYFLQLYVAFFSFGFMADVVARYGAVAVLVTFVLSSISMGVPSNGGIGPWQWAVIFALGIYGVPGAEAGAFANLVLGCNTLLLIALGLFTFVCIALGRRSARRRDADI